MKRSLRIHLVSGLATSLIGFLTLIASIVDFNYRVARLEATLQTGEDVSQVTSVMQNVFAGPNWMQPLGVMLIGVGALYSLIILAVWFVGPTESSTPTQHLHS